MVTAWPAIPGTTEATQKTWQPLFQGALLGENDNDAVVEGVAETLAQVARTRQVANLIGMTDRSTVAPSPESRRRGGSSLDHPSSVTCPAR